MDSETHSEPCASKLHHSRLHPALSEHHDLGPDIYDELVSWVFAFEPFEYWQRSEKNWELKCPGPPGSGKTTFAALAARELRAKYPSKGSAVASIFIVKDVRWSKDTFIEDFLGSIFRQLKTGHACAPQDDARCNVHEAVMEYVDACRQGQRGATRIRLIRRALDLCVAGLDKAFLVLDGIDRCSTAMELFLEDEFPRLRANGLRIMITSRIPCLRIPPKVYKCDIVNCPDPRARLVYWLCQEPECKRLKIVVCLTCKERNAPCNKCGGHNLQQPYEHVNLDIMPSGQKMQEFIARSLEQEHGDLGLGTSPTTAIPPPSRLGAELMEVAGGARNLVRMLEQQASYNVAMARVRLDLVDAAPSLTAALDIGDRLPASITAVFDAGIRAIEAQPPGPRALGLRAIAAVAHAEQNSVECENTGLTFGVLDKWLHEAESLGSARALGSSHVPHRGLEDVLQASNGFLVVEPYDGDVFVKTYHDDFTTWVSEGYDEALVAAASQMQFGRLQRLSRVQTFAGRNSGDRTDKEHAIWFGEEDAEVKELKTKRPQLQGGGSARFGGERSSRFKLPRSATAWIN